MPIETPDRDAMLDLVAEASIELGLKLGTYRLFIMVLPEDGDISKGCVSSTAEQMQVIEAMEIFIAASQKRHGCRPASKMN